MNRLVVTGTSTEVGKTVVTAALAALDAAAGRTVTVVKPAQTGIAPGAESDSDVISRLSGVTDVHELARYPEPLAPATAARRAGTSALPVSDMVQQIADLHDRDLVLVEGAGGLLVRLDDEDRTIADIAAGLNAPLLVVAAPGLGTLNAVALTCEAIRSRGLECAGVVIGRWPQVPDLAALANLDDIETYAQAPLLGALPEGSGELPRAEFLAVAQRSLLPALGGLASPRVDPAVL